MFNSELFNKTSQALKLAAVTAIAGSALLTSSSVFAGNCLNVKPHVKNESGKMITVTTLIYKRNGYTYREKIQNAKVSPGYKAKYGGQRLGHVNSGHDAYFGVEFKARRDRDNKWVHMSILKPNDERCWDGKVVNIKVRESDITKARR